MLCMRFFLEPFSGARLGLVGMPAEQGSLSVGKACAAYLDLRTLGDVTRNEGMISQTITCPDTFTTAVCYLGIAQNTDSLRAEKLCRFFSWLLEEQAQEELAALGAFCACSDVEQVFAVSSLTEFNQSYRELITVDPIRWAGNREALFLDAALCMEGDEYAKARFFERLELVLLQTV